MPIKPSKQIRYKQFLQAYEAQNKLESADSDESIDEFADAEADPSTAVDQHNANDYDEDSEEDSSSDSDDSHSDSSKYSKESDSVNNADESGDNNGNTKCSRYSSRAKINLNRLLDLNDDSKFPIFTREEIYCLQFINVPSPMLDSLLLQKLTHLDNDVAEKLIYECLLNMEKISYSDDELDEDSLRKLVSLRKSISICDDEDVKEVMVLEIYNLLHARLFNDKERTIRMFIYTLDQLNEKSKFYITNTDIMMMLDKFKKPKKKINYYLNACKQPSVKTSHHRKSRRKEMGKVMKKIDVQESDEKVKTVAIKTEEEKPVITTDTKEADDGDNNKDTEESEDDRQKIDEHESSDENTPFDENYKEDCGQIIQEFKEFLAEHCQSGVQSLGKVITSHISDTISKIKSQKIAKKAVKA